MTKIPNNWILLGLMIFLLALGYAWSRIHVVELGYEVTQLRNEIEKIKQENSLFQSQMAAALSTHRLLEMARRHGMKPPESRNIYFISEPKE